MHCLLILHINRATDSGYLYQYYTVCQPGGGMEVAACASQRSRHRHGKQCIDIRYSADEGTTRPSSCCKGAVAYVCLTALPTFQRHEYPCSCGLFNVITAIYQWNSKARAHFEDSPVCAAAMQEIACKQAETAAQWSKDAYDTYVMLP